MIHQQRVIDRPLDLLNYLRGRTICVTLKDEKEMVGTLVAFDIHVNLVIEINGANRFVRGDMINWISETSENIELQKKRNNK